MTMRFYYRRLRFFVVLTCVFITACTKLGPDFKSPELAMPKTWQDSDLKTAKQADYRNWWKLFNDPILNQLVTMAYAQNLDLQIAATRILEARAQLGIAKGSLFPQKQQFDSSLAYNKLSEQIPNINRFSYGGFDMGFDAVWEADLWGKFRRGIESADANLGATMLNYDDVLVSLTAEVAANYMQLRTFQQRLLLAKQNADIQAQSLRITEARLRNGIGNELDVQQATAVLHNTNELLANLATGIRQTRNALCILLGQSPNDLGGLLGEPQPIPDITEAINTGIPADILRRRPDVRREELKAAAQSAMIGVAKADLLPRLSLAGSIGLASSSANGFDAFDVLGEQALAAKIGPTISWPILHYGRLKNNVRVQDAKFEQLLLGYKNSVLRALREVEDALIGVQNTKQQITELQQGVTASKKSVALSLLQYRSGLEDYTRVLNSQQLLVQQQDQLTTRQGDRARNIIALYKALGGGWETRQGKGQLPAAIREELKKRTDWQGFID